MTILQLLIRTDFISVNSGRSEVSRCRETSPFKVNVTSGQEVKRKL